MCNSCNRESVFIVRMECVISYFFFFIFEQSNMKEFGKVCDAESVMFLLRENHELITVEFSVVTDSLVEEASK